MSGLPPPPSDPGPGDRIGPFLVLGILGQGASGRVFHVREPSGRELALKLLTTARPASVRRFLREGEVTARLRHPGIVSVHAAGEHAGCPYLVYELVPGETLDQRLPESDRATRLRLVLEVARAVGYAHEQGVLHRDLKPENVVIDASGHARVVDFGVAQVSGYARMTQTGALVGSPAYMSPEQITAERARFGPATDVWALGVMLYVALTDCLPFDGASFVELLTQITTAPPRSPRSLDPEIPAPLATLCMRALSKDPEGRPPTGAAFAAELEAALPLGDGPRIQSSRTWLGAAGVVVLAGCALALAVWTPGTHPAPRPPTQTAAASPDVRPPEPLGPTPAEILSRVRERTHELGFARALELVTPLLDEQGLTVAQQTEVRMLLGSIHAQLSEGLRMKGDLDAAEVELRRAEELAPSLTVVLLERAWLHFDRDEAQEALPFFARALERDLNHASAHFGRGLCLARLGNLHEAREPMESAVALRPGKRRYAVQLAQLCKALGDDQGLERALSRALAAEGERDEVYAELLAQRARVRSVLGDHSGAVADASLALEYSPQVALLYRVRGRSYAALGESVPARADLQQAVELDPEDSDHLNALIHFALAEGELAWGLELTARAVRLFPNDAHLWIDRAQALEDSGDLAGAQAAFSTALDVPVNSSSALQVRALLRRAKLRAYAGPRGALEDVDLASELSEDTESNLHVLAVSGRVLCRLGRPREALTQLLPLTQAQLTPRRGLSLRSTLRFAHLVAGDFSESMRFARGLLEGDPPTDARRYIELSLAVCGDAEALDSLGEVPAQSWLGQLVRFARDGDATRLLAAARADEGAHTAGSTPDQRACEAHYYVALTHDLRGEREAACLHYRACVGTGAVVYSEFEWALGRLRFLLREEG